MSDYMFMLDSHLSSEQSSVLAQVRDAAAQANLNLFLTGGAMRDMLGGFPIRDLDFTIEGGALKFAKSFAPKVSAEIVTIDDNRKCAELVFPNGVTAEISMAREEKAAKPGGKPHVRAATIYEDLCGRDFTVNAIGLSLSKASYGLLLDPSNGLADIERKELHAVTNHAFYDDPARVLRLFRLGVRLGYTFSERTKSQLESVREAGLVKDIGVAALNRELRQIALEPLTAEVLHALEQAGLLKLFSPALEGAKLNIAGFQKLQKARQVLTSGGDVHLEQFTLFLNTIFEKLTPKEKTQFIKTSGVAKSDVEAAAKLETNAKKLEKALTSAKLQKPSALYALLSKSSKEELVFLLRNSTQRLVVDRVKNYFQKYLPMALEVTDAMVEERGGKPGTPKFAKLRDGMIAVRLDARPKKVVPVEAPPPLPVPPVVGRRQSTWGR
jgi:tRNA nucleotidyltransferase (CCA-adding enzyme)